MKTKKKLMLKLLLSFVACLFLTSFAFAAPIININSPRNMNYENNKVAIDINSSEPVNFYFKNERTGEKRVVEENVDNLTSFIYAKPGTYDFTIWAENESGETSETVSFTVTSDTESDGPVEVTSCGTLYSSDTDYILMNDISTTSYRCLTLSNVRNVTLNLNGYTINSGYRGALAVHWSYDVHVFNGAVKGSPVPLSGSAPWILEIEGANLKFEDLFIEGYVGVVCWPLDSVMFNNVTVNSSTGIWFEAASNIYFVNSSILWNGVVSGWTPKSAFWAWGGHAKSIILEDTTIDGNFPENLNTESASVDFYLRNTNIDLEKIYYSPWASDTRFFKQHLIILEVSDQHNVTGPTSVEIADNGIFPAAEGIEAGFTTQLNPSAHALVPIDKNGQGSIWLNEKLINAKGSDPIVVTEYDFSPYTLTAVAWGSDEVVTEELVLTDQPYTIPVSITIQSPEATLPPCEVSSMLDLNNDGVVDIEDTVIIMRYITELPIVVSEELKGCEALNFIIP